MLSQPERDQLLALARQGVRATVCRQELPKPAELQGVLGQQRGCFVTLTNAGHLRGCIGTFVPDRPLGRMIVEMAAAAARDPRFTDEPITPAELDQVKVEVSVLSQLQKTDQPEKLEVGKHGIYIVSRAGAGCFLPEVATDQGWSTYEFLTHCCLSKAGLPHDAWRTGLAVVYLFTSEKFGD